MSLTLCIAHVDKRATTCKGLALEMQIMHGGMDSPLQIFRFHYPRKVLVDDFKYMTQVWRPSTIWKEGIKEALHLSEKEGKITSNATPKGQR